MKLEEKFDLWQYHRLNRRIAKYEEYMAKVKVWLKEDKKRARKLKWKWR